LLLCEPIHILVSVECVPALSELHDHTYGITLDPLTQFACVFSALIHDVDHSGVPNAELISENTELVQWYHGKSVAEQNSFDLAWNLLRQPEYTELLGTICSTKTEYIRFRQLVVNTVLATDIMDPELKDIRNVRWLKPFVDPEESLLVTLTTTDIESHTSSCNVSPEEQTSKLQETTADQVHRKATIVIEHMIQASDVSHTMQHWHIYHKWSVRFFMECYDAYLNGYPTTTRIRVIFQSECIDESSYETVGCF
jgi:3'5'-cyclic nucleotide phosphodiesterase